MCTQLTYEGMLDEFVGIKNGQSPNIDHAQTDFIAL